MGCITTVNYAVLINGKPSPFFGADRGLRQGCALSPLIFILIMNGFSCLMDMAWRAGYFTGFSFSNIVSTSHSLFVDDMLIFGMIVRNQWLYLHYMFNHFSVATRLCINKEKSFIIHGPGDGEEISYIASFLGVKKKKAIEGFTYLGYRIKPSTYRNNDWAWLVEKIKTKICKWTHKWLTLGGRLIMVKAVLSQIIVF